MSLLLEALKKAELAKQRAASADSPREREEPAERATPVMTREKLPDIGQHVEIHTDDLPSANPVSNPMHQTQAPRPLELTIAPEPEPRRAAPQDERLGPDSQEAARRLFEVKEIEYNPKRPFYLTLIALGAVGVGYGTYVWWQLQPKYAYNAQAIRDSKEKTAPSDKGRPPALAAAAATPATAPASASASSAPPRVAAVKPAAAAASSETAVDALPPRRTPPPAASRAAPAPTAPPQAARPPVAAAAPPSDPTRSWQQSIAINPSSLQVDPQLERAYEAVQRNELDVAREIYRTVLQRDASNRDALLGMAAIEVRTRNFEIAEARYLRLLELDPRDGHAHAGLLALRQADPVASESRLKNLLVNQPDSAQLLFALGNQYAVQSRWSEAQQAYFRALAAEPENPDYAFNLAVSLDHMHQKARALEFYRRALVLVDKRPGSFDRALAAARVQDLQR